MPLPLPLCPALARSEFLSLSPTANDHDAAVDAETDKKRVLMHLWHKRQAAMALTFPNAAPVAHSNNNNNNSSSSSSNNSYHFN
ncbi:hypothetical protein AWZ03_002183 [Drosophila navojoa]|uniref:Uncharacterized protein n=1 Tax=Drosophila navojoa TaxID=7232 RepID=A0A484BRI9_DRONA|nr:hypothetical protein AWZ03_002183 [Drosophila navojoa]